MTNSLRARIGLILLGWSAVCSLHDSALQRSDEKIDLGPFIGITESK